MNCKRKAAVSAAATAALVFALVTPALPAAASSAQSSSQSSQSSSAASGSRQDGCRHSHGFGAMKELAGITGMTEQQLMEKYPQKTAWQIAKALGKLDELKKGFLEAKRTELNALIKEGKLTSDQAAKIYTELSGRVAAIDGVNTVIVGRPARHMGSR